MKKKKRNYGVMCPRCGKSHFGTIIAYATTCKCGYLFNAQDEQISKMTK